MVLMFGFLGGVPLTSSIEFCDYTEQFPLKTEPVII